MRSSVAGDPLRSSTEHVILTLTLNRPDRRNAIDAEPRDAFAAERLLHMAADVDRRSGIVAESLAQTMLLQTEDHREGLAAALERREPTFKGT